MARRGPIVNQGPVRDVETGETMTVKHPLAK
jgi:hypothetical protein